MRFALSPRPPPPCHTQRLCTSWHWLCVYTVYVYCHCIYTRRWYWKWTVDYLLLSLSLFEKRNEAIISKQVSEKLRFFFDGLSLFLSLSSHFSLITPNKFTTTLSLSLWVFVCICLSVQGSRGIMGGRETSTQLNELSTHFACFSYFIISSLVSRSWRSHARTHYFLLELCLLFSSPSLCLAFFFFDPHSVSH